MVQVLPKVDDVNGFSCEFKHFLDGSSTIGRDLKGAYEMCQQAVKSAPVMNDTMERHESRRQHVFHSCVNDLMNKEYDSALSKPLKAYKSMLDKGREKIVHDKMMSLEPSDRKRMAWLNCHTSNTSWMRNLAEVNWQR